MTSYLHRQGMICLALSASTLTLLAMAPAQAQAPTRPGEPNPTTAPAVAPPDVQAFTGVWTTIKSWMTTPVPPKGLIPFTPEFEAKRAALEYQDKHNIVLHSRNAKCLPGGITDQWVFGFRIEANAEYMLLIGGEGPTVRPIWLNRNIHVPADQLFPTYSGDSIAHFEGKTLVIDTIGVSGEDEYTYGLAAGDDNMHVVERLTLDSPTQLTIQGTITDPSAFTKPWSWSMTYGRRPLDAPIVYCDYPSKDDSLDLTPPDTGYVPTGADK